jgi:hypothetical protein
MRKLTAYRQTLLKSGKEPQAKILMRTYNEVEIDLAFEWVDKFFALTDLIFRISGDEDLSSPPPLPSYEHELQFQALRIWFLDHQDEFMPIWSEFWQNKSPRLDSIDTIEDIEYLENPFLPLYESDDLCQLAHCLGMTKSIDTWEPTKQAVDMVLDITTAFSLKVFQFIQMIGEFTDD